MHNCTSHKIGTFSLKTNIGPYMYNDLQWRILVKYQTRFSHGIRHFFFEIDNSYIIWLSKSERYIHQILKPVIRYIGTSQMV